MKRINNRISVSDGKSHPPHRHDALIDYLAGQLRQLVAERQHDRNALRHRGVKETAQTCRNQSAAAFLREQRKKESRGTAHP